MFEKGYRYYDPKRMDILSSQLKCPVCSAEQTKKSIQGVGNYTYDCGYSEMATTGSILHEDGWLVLNECSHQPTEFLITYDISVKEV